jgi:RNA polymerase sigma factor (sigma-70 family)
MAITQPSIVLRHLRQMVAVNDVRAVPDQQLLDRFARQRDEAAFEALVQRHGPLVLGVCRRVLHNWHDAEDVFQATFLVLARKASSISKQASVGSWLYQVAYHMALKARKQASNRQRRARQTARRDQADPLAEVTGRELLAVLDEELQNLAECERSPLVLCYLEGKTRDEAARLLSCSQSTLNRRIEHAKDRLRGRLAQRGVALSLALLVAGLTQTATSAGVSHTLAFSTVQAVLASVSGKTAGVASAAATALAEGTLRAMSAAKLKLAIAVVLAVGLVALGAIALTHTAQAQRPTETATNLEAPPALEGKPKSGPPALPADNDDATKLTVTGCILAPDCKPAIGARVAVVARQGVLLSSWEGWSALRNDITGQGKTDMEGRFRLVVARPDPLMNVRAVRVLAMKEAVGLAWKAVDPNAEKADLELRLTPVQPVQGRLVGIQGEPVAGVTVHVARITRPPEKGEREEDAAIRPPTALPLAATTNARGEFSFACFGPNVKLELEIKDRRYQRKDEWFVETANKKQCEHLQLVLPPGQVVEGRIIYADTRKPVPHARLMIVSPYIIDDQADADGRFCISIFSGQHSKGDVGVHAYAPDGEPYMPASQGVHFDKGMVRREVEIALPRGVLLCGKITEAGTGKPVVGAVVTYNADPNVRVRSGLDGSYQIGGWPNAARLMVTHPSGEYLTRVLGSGGGSLDKPIGDPSYYHAVVAVDVKPDDKVKEVNITIHRGVTIAGRLVGPDEKPVASALLFVSSHKPRSEKTMHPVLVRDGKFEVPGCDPEQTYQLMFLEHPRLPPMLMMAEGLQTFGQLWLRELVNGTNRQGASMKVLAKKAASEPLVVRFAPCGSAKLRFTDADGKPKKDFIPWLQLVVTPGPPLWKAIEDKTLAAEVVTLAGPYGDQPPGQPKTDAQGYVTYYGLIPGATYRIKMYGRDMSRNIVLKDFGVEAGKTAELEIVVK